MIFVVFNTFIAECFLNSFPAILALYVGFFISLVSAFLIQL